MLKLEVRGYRAYLVQIRGGKRVKTASFPADGYKWWRDLIGTDELDDSFANYERVAKAYIFARVYPYTMDKAALVRTLREMEKFEAIYWMHVIMRDGLRAVSAFKKLFRL